MGSELFSLEDRNNTDLCLAPVSRFYNSCVIKLTRYLWFYTLHHRNVSQSIKLIGIIDDKHSPGPF